MEKELVEKYKNEIAVLVAVQKIGKATIEEIEEFLVSFGNQLKPKKIQNFCDKLQKKGLISISYTEGVKSYNMSKGIFSRGGAPIAHFNDIVSPQDDNVAEELKEIIEELEGKKGINKGRKPDICDYFMVKVAFKLIQGGCYGFRAINSETLEHYKDEKDNYILLPKHFRAWLRKNARLVNKTDSIKNYIGWNVGHVKLNGTKPYIREEVVTDGGQGRGFTKFEVLPTGVEIETSFSVPTTMFKPEEFKDFLSMAGSERALGTLTGQSSMNKPLYEVIKYEVM